MTVSSAASEIVYNGDGITASFPIPFAFDTADDLKVVETTNGNAVEVTGGFSISGGDGGPGSLTRSTALPSGTTLTIIDDPEFTQPTDYIDNDPFPAETHERALDRCVRLSKRLLTILGTAARVSDGDPASGASMLFPTVAARRGQFARWADSTIAQLEPAATLPDGTTLSQSAIGFYYRPQSSYESGAGVTPVNYFYEYGDVRRYGAVGNGVADCSNAFDDARDQCENGGAEVYIPPGVYCLSRTWTWSVHARCRIRGDDWPFTSLKWTAAVDGLVISSQHARVIGIHLDGNALGLSGLVEHNASQSVFDRVAAQNWTVDGNRISTTYTTPTGNCNFSRHYNCAFTNNVGWGARMPSVQGDQNAVEFTSCNMSGNSLGGLLVKGQACIVQGGLYEGNTGPGISLGDDSDAIVVSRNKIILPYLESNTTGVYAGATSVGNFILIDALNANSQYTHHANAENMAIWPSNTAGGKLSFGELAQMLSLYNVRSGGNRIQFVAEGTDANIPIKILPKGTGGLDVCDDNDTSNGLLRIGQGATGIRKHLSATAALDFDLTAVVSQDLTITVSGAALGDTVSLGIPNGSVTADTVFMAWVSAADTVKVRAMRGAGTPNPASGTFRVDVWKH